MKFNQLVLIFFCLVFATCALLVFQAEASPAAIADHAAVCSASEHTSEKLTFTSYFSGLLSTDNWPARWTCGEWSETEGWLYIGADFGIFLAYLIIPLLLMWYLFKQPKGGVGRRIMIFFSAFILFCGFTHLIDVVLFWEPVYRLSGFVKLLTATISLSAVVVFGIAIPRLLAFRSPEDMQLEIDDRKRFQNQFETLLKYSPNAIAMLDEQMKYLIVNEHWKKMLTTNEDVIGTYYEDSFPKTEGYLTWVQDVSEVLLGNQVPPREDRFNGEEGQFFFRRKIEPWKKANDEIGGVIIFIDDLTDEMQQQKLQNKYSQLIADISQTAGIGVWSTNLVTNDHYWNDEVYDIHGVKRGATVLDNDVEEFYDPQDWKKVQKGVAHTIETGEHWDLELKITDAKGDLKWVRSVGKAVFERGKAVELQGLVEDITESKLVQERLQKSAEKLIASNKALESFSYSISHDLRAPLRAINGYSEALVEDYADKLPEDASHFINRIASNSKKMGALIDDLLEFSRLNRKEVNHKELDTSQMIRRIIEDTFEGNEKQITIDPLPYIYGDPEMINQVFMNLLSNAIKYSSKNPNPQITVSFREETDSFIILVKDNGVGFDMKYEDKLFKVFQRLHSESDFEGTGIGLSLCKRVMDAHDGEIWAESEEGKGSTFYLRFKKGK